MLPHEAEQARTTLGLNRVELAVEKNVTPDAVAAWEAGRIEVPERIAIDLRWRVARKERIAALASSGLPACPWVAEFEKETIPTKLDDHTNRVMRLVEHTKSCEVCRSREHYLDERFGPMPPAPREGWVGVLTLTVERIQKLPAWAQPAVTGAIMFVAYSLLRLVFMLPAIARDPRHGLPTAALGILASGSIGAVVGFLYGVVQRFRNNRAAQRAA